MTFITTHSGKKLSLIDPQPEDICIEDIGHHLGSICRFNGAINRFYSVAQHSVFVADQIVDRIRLTALLHDAGEAYYGDMSSPFKEAMRELVGSRWGVILDRIDRVIRLKFNLKFNDCAEIMYADKVAIATEWRDFMSTDVPDCLPEPHPAVIVPFRDEVATKLFLITYRNLQ